LVASSRFWQNFSAFGFVCSALIFSIVLTEMVFETETCLVRALKQQMLKEIRETQPEKSMNSRLGSSSPGEIRTLVGGSKARYA
jgi:hypothetical protein